MPAERKLDLLPGRHDELEKAVAEAFAASPRGDRDPTQVLQAVSDGCARGVSTQNCPRVAPFWPLALIMRGSIRASVACWVAGFCATSGAAWPQAPRAGADTACLFEVLSAGKVAGVVDGRSFVLADGQEVRIAAIEVPPAPVERRSEPQATAGAAAKAALESMLLGQAVELHGSSLAIDRYARTVAFVQLPASGVSIAGAMVALGHARVAAHVGDAVCAADLLSRERVARAAKLGLWGNPYYEVMEAGNGSQLLATRGYFTVVEGKVLSVRESAGTIYLNFGRRWSEALTVTILKRQERIFSGVGVWPKRLENRIVRVRGFVEEHNGPRIEASWPEQIEIAGLK